MQYIANIQPNIAASTPASRNSALDTILDAKPQTDDSKTFSRYLEQDKSAGREERTDVAGKTNQVPVNQSAGDKPLQERRADNSKDIDNDKKEIQLDDNQAVAKSSKQQAVDAQQKVEVDSSEKPQAELNKTAKAVGEVLSQQEQATAEADETPAGTFDLLQFLNQSNQAKNNITQTSDKAAAKGEAKQVTKESALLKVLNSAKSTDKEQSAGTNAAESSLLAGVDKAAEKNGGEKTVVAAKVMADTLAAEKNISSTVVAADKAAAKADKQLKEQVDKVVTETAGSAKTSPSESKTQTDKKPLNADAAGQIDTKLTKQQVNASPDLNAKEVALVNQQKADSDTEVTPNAELSKSKAQAVVAENVQSKSKWVDSQKQPTEKNSAIDVTEQGEVASINAAEPKAIKIPSVNTTDASKVAASVKKSDKSTEVKSDKSANTDAGLSDTVKSTVSEQSKQQSSELQTKPSNKQASITAEKNATEALMADNNRIDSSGQANHVVEPSTGEKAETTGVAQAAVTKQKSEKAATKDKATELNLHKEGKWQDEDKSQVRTTDTQVKDSQTQQFEQSPLFAQMQSQQAAESLPEAAKTQQITQQVQAKQDIQQAERNAKTQQQVVQLKEHIQLQKPEAATALNDAVRFMMNGRVQAAELRLDPPELGSMQIKISLNGDAASVSMLVQNQQAKDMLDQSVPKLREMLEQQGLELSDSQVEHRQADSGQGSGQQSQAGGGQSSADDGQDDDSTQVIEQKIHNGHLGAVDYYA